MFSLCQGLTRGDLSVPSEPRNCRGDEATEEQRLQDLGGFLDHHSKRPCAPDGLQTRDASHDGALAAASMAASMSSNGSRIVQDCSGRRFEQSCDSWSQQHQQPALISFDQLCNMQATSNDGFVLVDSCRSSNLCLTQLLPVNPRLILDLGKDLTSPVKSLLITVEVNLFPEIRELEWQRPASRPESAGLAAATSAFGKPPSAPEASLKVDLAPCKASLSRLCRSEFL